MGRWTPLILMAGGLAILLGTLLGINFPMGGQNASVPPPVRGRAQVLPANINVNSTATRNQGENPNSVAQNNTQDSTSENNQEQIDNAPDSANDNTQSGDNQSTDTNQTEPVRALW
jgi:hypothetical protein